VSTTQIYARAVSRLSASSCEIFWDGMQNARVLLLCSLLTIALGGCAAVKTVQILTEPPGAAILIDGAYMGDSPLQITIRTTPECEGARRMYGGPPCTVTIEAQPRRGMSGERLYTQKVRVAPKQMASDKIFMNLRLEPVAPTQPVELR